jgi:hypothetical protein
MNTIKMFLAESGRIAEIKKDFPLYQGQYQNKLLNVYVPTSILAPNFSVQQAGQTIADYVSSTAVKIGMRTIERNGKIQTSKTYYMRYLKTLTYQNIEYALYERKLPREFTFYAGQGENAPTLIANVVNINNETTPATILDVTTSQTCSLDVMPSNYLDKDEPIEATEFENISAQLNEISELLAKKQNREDESLETDSKYVVGAINENKRNIAENTQSIQDNTQAISQNRNAIDELQEMMASGETYIGAMRLETLPSDTQLNQFVLQEKGRQQASGDSIIVSISQENDTDKNYKYIYNGTEWSYYEIPALGLSENGVFGAIKGTYAVGDTNNLLVDISGGKIVDIYVKNGDGNYLSVRQYLNQNSQNIEDIISGDIMVGEAIRAIEDEMGNNISNTYLTKVLGATKQFVRDYAQPREISEIYFISQDGYSRQIPTTPADGVQFETTTTAVGSFQLFEISKQNTASFELSSLNGYNNNIHISASADCSVSLRLTTSYKKLGEDWQVLSVELSNIIDFVSGDIQRISLSSLFVSLGDNIAILDGNAQIRQKLEIVSQTSTPITFRLYSSELYPSTFSLTTQNYILGSIDQAKSQIIMIGADGVVEDNNVVLTIANPTSYEEYKTNQREFILNANIPVVGDLSELTIRITFGNTVYNLYSFDKGGNTPLKMSDIASSTTYNTNIGYSFNIRIIFLETSDVTGFVLSPSTITAQQIVNIIGNDSSVVGSIDTLGKLLLTLDPVLQNKVTMALSAPITAPLNTELVGINTANSQVMVELGDKLTIENDKLDLSNQTITTLNFAESERQKCKNLFNINDYSVKSGYVVFPYTLQEGKEYTFSSNSPITQFKISDYRYGTYYAQKEDMDGFTSFTFTPIRPSSISEDKTVYIFISIVNDLTPITSISDLNGYEIQIEVGDVATEYQPYNGAIVHENNDAILFAESERQKTLNLFNANAVTRGYSLSSSNGENLPDSLWYVSDYINVQGLSSVIISGIRDSGQSNCFYNANKTFISTYKAIKGYIPVPSNAVYMRINGLISQLGDGYTNISQGDTVHNSIIQGIAGVVLWENPNKKADFVPQVITMSNSLSYFDYCALEYETVVPSNEVINCRQYLYFRPIVGGNVENMQGGWDSGTRYIKARAFRVLTETTIDMYTGWQEGNINDRMMVPLRIIGYKKGV